MQEIPDYAGDLTFQEIEGTLDQAVQQQNERQSSWLKRARDGGRGDEKLVRPRKRHRKSSYVWLCALHNQLLQYIEKGLLHFLPDSDPDKSMSSTPRLSISPDMGSDGVPAVLY